jgi:hypothetical protein
MTRCFVCGEPILAGSLRCPNCRAVQSPQSRSEGGVGLYLLALVLQRFPQLRDRYGTLPLFASLGVLPLFPVTPLIGVICGITALLRIKRHLSPREGQSLAIMGLVGGVAWMTLGIIFVSKLVQWVDFFFQSPRPPQLFT